MAMRHLLSKIEADSDRPTSFDLSTQFEMPCTPFTKELVLAILRPTLFDFPEWVYEVLELGLQKELDPADLVESTFRFHPLLLNFLQECPYELLTNVYYAQVISGLCLSVESVPVSAIQAMMRCVLSMGLLKVFV